MVKIQGKEYVTYEERLAMAHTAGLKSIDVDLVQWDGETAVSKATVELAGGIMASDIGSANSENTGRAMVPHRVTMSATRAKSRALGIVLNIGEVSPEELDSDEPPIPREEEYSGMRGAAKAASDARDGGKVSENNAAKEPTEKQLNFIATLADELYSSTSELEEEMEVSMEDLTRSEASSLINELNRKKRGESEGSMF